MRAVLLLHCIRPECTRAASKVQFGRLEEPSTSIRSQNTVVTVLAWKVGACNVAPRGLNRLRPTQFAGPDLATVKEILCWHIALIRAATLRCIHLQKAGYFNSK